MKPSTIAAPLRAALLVLSTLAAVRCASSGDAPATAPIAETPKEKPPAPAIVTSADSVGASATAGAGAITLSVDITPANATAVTGLAVTSVDGGASRGDWISASLSSETAPARLTITLKPAALTAGTYDASVRIAAVGADPKTIRASLVVKPRPRLVLEQSALAIDSDLGVPIGSKTIGITSIDGAIDSISVGPPDCGTASPWVAATLSGVKTPATLTIGVAPGALGAGIHSCSIGISTSQALVDSARQVMRVSLTLRARPRLSLSADTVRTSSYRLSDVDPLKVAITNAGTGTLSGLTVGTISYSPGTTDWLVASLDSTTAPATLTLIPNAKILPSGQYSATVPISSSAPDVAGATRTVVVVFDVVPRPSVLVATPSQKTFTIKQGVSLSTSYQISLTHSGDVPIRSLAFGIPVISPSQPPTITVPASIGCFGANFSTPCVVTMFVQAPANLPPGSYSWTYPLPGIGVPPALATVTVVVTP